MTGTETTSTPGVYQLDKGRSIHGKKTIAAKKNIVRAVKIKRIKKRPGTRQGRFERDAE